MFTLDNRGFERFWGDWTILFDRSNPSAISLVLPIMCVVFHFVNVYVVVIAKHPSFDLPN